MSSDSCVHSGGVVLSLIQYTQNNSKINRDLSYLIEGIYFTTNNVAEDNKRMCFTKDLLILFTSIKFIVFDFTKEHGLYDWSLVLHRQ